jgi:hypothetical protein
VKEQFEAYLGCGLVPRGCLHVRGEQCGAEMVVAFSCKGHLCPSCGGRRKTALAAQLVDRVVPDVPVRQWVLSLPWSLGYQMAFAAALCRDVLAVHPGRVRLVWAPGGAPRDRGQSMRGGHRDPALRGAQNLNVHFRSLVLDGVFTRSQPTAAPVFHALPAPTDAEVADVLDGSRVMPASGYTGREAGEGSHEYQRRDWLRPRHPGPPGHRRGHQGPGRRHRVRPDER